MSNTFLLSDTHWGHSNILGFKKQDGTLLRPGFVDIKEHDLELIKRCNPEKGDILYTKNGTIGVAKKISWDYEFSIFVSLCLLKPNTQLVFTDYLVHYLNTKMALNQALSHTKTGTISNLHLIEIKKIKQYGVKITK